MARQKAGLYKGPDMTVIKANVPEHGTCRGTIAMCVRDKVSAQTAMSMMIMEYPWLRPGEYLARYVIIGNVLTMQRNQCVRMMDGDWIMFIDADMVWQSSDVATLVESRDKWDLDMIGGLCFQRGDPYQPTLYMDAGDGGYTFMERWPEDTAIPVDATGMAFVIIHKRVFDAILRQRTGEGFPSFEERQQMPPPPFFTWREDLGEDFRFCREAKEAGCQIHVDTAVKIGHVGEIVITERTFLQEVALRSSEADAARASQLSGLGLEALTHQEARQMLGWEE